MPKSVTCRRGHIAKRYKSGHCAECLRIAAEKWRAKNPVDPVALRDYNRQAKRKERGMPEPTRPEPKRCECCREPAGRLRLDHDHVTGKFRGWLCDKCNRGLGMLGDTLRGVKRAVAYLTKNL